MKHIVSILFFVLLEAVGSEVARGQQERAIIPYERLLKIGRGNDQSESREKVDNYRLKIVSSRSTDPKDITLTLNTTEGPQLLFIDKNGFFNLPYSQRLEGENPLIISNQPKGTLNISFSITVPPFDPPKIEGGRIRYQELFKPLIELQKEIRKVEPNFGLTGYGQLVLRIETSQPIKLTRMMGTGEKAYSGVRTYQPDDQGVVMMALEPYTFEANPEVSVPDEKIKLGIVPVDPLQLIEIKAKY